MKKTVLAAALIALSATSQAADKLNIMLDWFINPDHAALIVAREKGYFAQHDLDINIIEPSDPSLAPKMVAAGNADLAVSYQPQLYLQHQEGLPVIRVSTLIASPLNTIIVKKDSDIKTLADLKGKKIGYSVAGADDVFIKTMLANAGLSENDVEKINVNWNLSSSVTSGQVDAVIGGFRNFELTEMQLHGVPGRAFYVEEHGVPIYDELIVIANKNNYDRDVLARFNQALAEATQFTLNHPQDAWQLFLNAKPELDDALNNQAWGDTLPRLALRPGALDQRRYQQFGQFLQEYQLIDKAPAVAEIAVEP